MKVLILTELIAGTGHHKAAENIAKGILAAYPQAIVEIDTSLSHVNPVLERLTSKLYMNTIQHAAKLWGWAYKRDREWSLLGKQILRKYVAKRLFAYINAEAPDIIVSTHAFCLGGLAELKKKVKKPFRLGVALTDYCVNSFWIHDEVDHYFVGATELKTNMIERYRVADEKISITGIPIEPRFGLPLDKAQLRGKLNISKEIPHILVMGGGLGLAPFMEVLKGLALVREKIGISVITGKNQEAKWELEQWLLTVSYPHSIQVKDYVTNMEEWMGASDLLIGKSGGLTVTEALACQLPLLIYKPIPGQEEKNSKFLLESQIAFRVDQCSELPAVVERFLEDQKLAETMKQRARQFSNPDAAYKVGKILCANLE